MKTINKTSYSVCESISFSRKGNGLALFLKAAVIALLMLLTVTVLHAQSGGWDAIVTVGTAGNNDYGNGVIRLLSDVNTGCSGAAVHETTPANQYDPTLGNFSHCYQVFFGCPGNDNIGSDVNGDGMAFSFWKSTATYNINNGLACGGGLGYMGSASDGKMISIEFDTWSSQCNTNFDCLYGGGTSGNHDEIALQRDGNASDVGRITSVDAGNLEDGLEHTVCIGYNRTTYILSVTIDGSLKFSYDLTGSPYELSSYFGAGGLNQTWSSGKAGATNPSTVTPNSATSIVANLGGVPLCPAGVEITSPSNGAVFSGCPIGPITINATPSAPASTTTNYLEFFVDGVSIGTDNSSPYSINYTPTSGSHSLTVTAHWSDGSSSNSIAPVNINVGGINQTSTAPLIDGTIDPLWSSYPSFNLTKSNGATGSDLSAYYKIIYDGSYLYILVDVTDDFLRNNGGANYQKDGVEIYIDKGNTKTGCCSYAANDFQYVTVYNDATLYETYHSPGSTAGASLAQGLKAGGYIKEVKIPWSSLGGAPTPGNYLGFDVSINDNDNAGQTRDNQLSWNDGTYGEWQDPSKFGTLQFTGCDPLPVKLLTFNGKIINETTLLNWTTAQEINNKEFIIERSVDGANWESIGIVAGVGNTTSVTRYTYTDYTPLNGISYYRLMQVDVDGTSTYSNAIYVEWNAHHHINLMPNPFDQAFAISSDVSGNMTISIYDVLGSLVYQVSKESNDGTLSIHPELAAGTYIITMQTSSFIEQQKIIKK